MFCLSDDDGGGESDARDGRGGGENGGVLRGAFAACTALRDQKRVLCGDLVTREKSKKNQGTSFGALWARGV